MSAIPPPPSPLHDQRPDIVVLCNDKIRVQLSTHGARVLGLYLRNRDGSETNVTLGLPGPDDYSTQDSSIGAICGRFANRIGGACYPQDGKIVRLTTNEGHNHLHGGSPGFDDRLWQVEQADDRAATFVLSVPDGDQGYPGRLDTRVTYRLVQDDTLQCHITATCDRPTVVNLTHHAYWNLGGDFGNSAADHRLQIDADAYLPVDEALIPLPGAPSDVAGTAFDFRQPAVIADRLAASGGFDHNFCLNGSRGTLRPVALLHHPASGRTLRLSSTETGLQFYLAKHFTPVMRSREGRLLHPTAGIALESQTWPDSPNRPDFPSPRLVPGEVYDHRIEWQFGNN